MRSTPNAMAPLDLTRTRAALAAYDAALVAFDEAATVEDLAPLQAAESAVGEAFALDTADRNDPAVARDTGVHWLRRLAATVP